MFVNLKIRSCLLVVLGGMILAFGVYNIHSISPITEGGVLGLALLLEDWINLSPSISGFALNALCYFVGWRVLGCKFIIYSAFAGASFSLFYTLFEMFPPLFPQIAEFPAVAATAGALFVGAGVGISVRFGGAPTGDDAIAMGISKKTKLDIKWIYLISDGIVLLLSLTYIPAEKILYSLFTVILSGQIISLISYKSKKEEFSLAAVPDEERCVLVGTTKGAQQVRCALENKFYHIPAVRLSKDAFPIKYVAIYQSLYKFGKDAGVFYYGEVVKCSRVKRSKIKEIPRNSDSLYYRFDVKEWIKLPNPIRANGTDIVNISVSLPVLLKSRNITELSLKTDRERQLYLKLSELLGNKNGEFAFEKANISYDGENILVTVNGVPSFSCNKHDFIKNPVSVTEIIVNIF